MTRLLPVALIALGIACVAPAASAGYMVNVALLNTVYVTYGSNAYSPGDAVDVNVGSSQTCDGGDLVDLTVAGSETGSPFQCDQSTSGDNADTVDVSALSTECTDSYDLVDLHVLTSECSSSDFLNLGN